jgi:hypothetical protein
MRTKSPRVIATGVVQVAGAAMKKFAGMLMAVRSRLVVFRAVSK